MKFIVSHPFLNLSIKESSDANKLSTNLVIIVYRAMTNPYVLFSETIFSITTHFTQNHQQACDSTKYLI